MLNLHPDTAKQDPRIMKAVVRLNENNAGAYATVARTGQISVGQPVSLILEHGSHAKTQTAIRDI
jgi:MOSC domain-containing protein YiiM